MDMIDRVANAIGQKIEGPLSGRGTVTLGEVARAAIEAMREPTDAMLEQRDQYGESCWRAMIDAALAPKS